MGKPSAKALGKRKAPPMNHSSKKAKPGKESELGQTGKPKRKIDQPKKVKLKDQRVIPVPRSVFAKPIREDEGNDTDEDDMGDEDEDFDEEMADLGEEEGLDGAFLASIDEKGLRRSMKETKRLHELDKANEPVPKAKRAKSSLQVTDLPSGSDISDYGFDSNDDLDLDEDLSGSGVEDLSDGDMDEDELSEEDFDDSLHGDDDEEEDDEEEQHEKRKRKLKESEADYETTGRGRWTKPEEEESSDEVEVGRLPIKLPTGEIKMVEGTTKLPAQKKKKPVVQENESEDDEIEEEESEDEETQAARMASQKGRFGRMGIAEIVSRKGWKNVEKLDAAKEQIAALGAEILAGGELIDNGPLLTRLSTFGLPTVKTQDDEGEEHVLNVPASIRGLAFLSQLAVYKDLAPGYRIRQLTAIEEAEKVRDEVRRLREGEKMLVRSYKAYLKMLETEIKAKSPLASLSLKCMCELLSAIPHFNFSDNIMGVLVGRIGRRSWDSDADAILQTFIDVFQSDLSAIHSQTLVRLIARMIKERKFQIHPNVLSCLLHLRLRNELNGMKDDKAKSSKSKKPEKNEIKPKFKSEIRKKWQTKKQKKAEKDMKEVQKELAEAEAEVNIEERATIQTETLKNLFVLYFSILKHPKRSPLLPAALEGISNFAHFINVDFFRDLLAVLRRIILDQYDEDDDESTEIAILDPVGASQRIRLRLLAIVTAFDLLSGQGESLNLDLTDFINQLFALLRPLSLDTGIEDPPLVSISNSTSSTYNHIKHRTAVHHETTASLLFKCLRHIFLSKTFTSPPLRAAAFAKRLLESSLFFPTVTAVKSIDFVRQLVAKYPKLEGLLDTEERMADGVYKMELDDPQLVNPFASNFFEIDILVKHLDGEVRRESKKLGDGNAAV